MDKKYFRVTEEWMRTYKFEEIHGAKVFEVVRTHLTPASNVNVIVLRCPYTVDKEWHVFESRGHFVAPYTLVLSDGLFMPALADVELSGSDLLSQAEFDSFEAAQEAAIGMNNSIRLAYAESIPKAIVDNIPQGSFVRRLTSDGFAMNKTYRRELFDSERGKFPLVDPLNPFRVFYVTSGTLLAVDSDESPL